MAQAQRSSERHGLKRLLVRSVSIVAERALRNDRSQRPAKQVARGGLHGGRVSYLKQADFFEFGL
jgi:hypothetical protein